MASRYPTTKVVDYCLNPLHLKDADKDVVVPCGKCNGCRVHAANVWSMRLGMEIESCPYSVFVTPTYSNWYLPRLVCVSSDDDMLSVWSSNHYRNWRFAGLRCSLRNDNITLTGDYDPVPVTNDCRNLCSIPYASKLDLQLYFKLLRKSLVENGTETDKFGRYFRYFAISEYGETKYRPHYHIIFFPCTEEVFEQFTCSCLLYQNWQMCDESLFNDNIKPCNSGTRNYLTQYVNSITCLPQVYKELSLRPFRLSSKGPAIGFGIFDLKEIFENLSIGITEYSRRVERLTDQYVLQYPKTYLSSIFPKCQGYSRKSYDALLRTYGAIYKYRVGYKHSPAFSEKVADTACHRLSLTMRSSDYNAACKMYKIHCTFKERYGLWITPFHYLFLLDMYYYKADMYALKLQYEYQQTHSSLENIRLYNNIGELVLKLRSGSCTNVELLMLDYFFQSFGIDSLDLLTLDLSDLVGPSRPDAAYVNELKDILETMCKMPKVNETLGVSPVNQTI